MQDDVELLFDTIELGLGATCADDDRCDSLSGKFRRDLIDQIGKNQLAEWLSARQLLRCQSAGLSKYRLEVGHFMRLAVRHEAVGAVPISGAMADRCSVMPWFCAPSLSGATAGTVVARV